MPDKQWYVDQHRKMWNWIADQIETRKSTQQIFRLKKEYCLAIDEKPKFYCFSCEYDMNDINAPYCAHCLFEFGGSSAPFSCEEYTSVYFKCKIAKTWQEQAALARKIANLPVREYV